MFSSYLNPAEDKIADARWSGPGGDILVELKHTSNVRDLRDALLALAYRLEREGGNTLGLCVLVKTRFAEQRLQEELARFRTVVRPGLGEKIFLAALGHDGRFSGTLPPDCPEPEGLLKQLVPRALGVGRVSRQAVKAFLVECWLDGLGPQSLASLGRETGASYPTVVAALADLRALGVLREDGGSGAALREPKWEAWRRLAESQAADRKIMRFVDPSGVARLPSQLASRLQSLQGKGLAHSVRIGGVLGALALYPELDITAAPRLDLSVYDDDIDFMRRIDAGLRPSDDPDAKAAVVLHLSRKPNLSAHDGRRGRYAAPALDCLADLLEMGYQAEARDFAHALARLPSRDTHAV